MSDSEEASRSPAYRLIHHYREQAMAAVQRLNQSAVSDQVDATVQRDLAAAALNYYYALYEFRESDALDEEWGDRGIEWLEHAENRRATVEQDLPRANGATKTTTQPYLLSVDPARIKRVILELNDIAQELGFSAETRRSEPRTEITDEMIEEVEEWRQNNLE